MKYFDRLAPSVVWCAAALLGVRGARRSGLHGSRAGGGGSPCGSSGSLKREAWLFLTLGLYLGAACSTTAEREFQSPATTPDAPTDTEVSLSGQLLVIWGDPPGPGGSPSIRYMLADAEGQTTRLLLDEELVTRLGGPMALNRRQVTLVGVTVTTPPGAVRVRSLEVVREGESRT